jgi:hypothetical protein
MNVPKPARVLERMIAVLRYIDPQTAEKVVEPLRRQRWAFLRGGHDYGPVG